MRTVFFLILCLFAPLTLAFGQSASFTLIEQIELPTHIPKELAREALRARIRLHSLQHICQDLKSHPHIAAQVGTVDYPAIAALAYTSAIEEETRSDNTVTVRLTARQNEASHIREAANNPDLLEVAGHFVSKTEAILRTIDAFWPTRLYIGKLTKKAPVPQEQHSPQKEESMRLARTLTACALAFTALDLRKDSWLTDREALTALEEAVALDETDPYLLLLLAESRVIRHLPRQAILSASQAIRLKGDLARARYIRALAYKEMEQFALAENDLSVVLDRPGGKNTKSALPALLARANLRQNLEKYAGMCEDLEEACRLGDCEALHRARREERCLR
ncbi:MAG: hypothetical protein IJU76_08630 [Desulfovibrionaceae bacterium]|nr:hypothetical protein [Desulfovibrionaceae bacterium]